MNSHTSEAIPPPPDYDSCPPPQTQAPSVGQLIDVADSYVPSSRPEKSVDHPRAPDLAVLAPPLRTSTQKSSQQVPTSNIPAIAGPPPLTRQKSQARQKRTESNQKKISDYVDKRTEKKISDALYAEIEADKEKARRLKSQALKRTNESKHRKGDSLSITSSISKPDGYMEPTKSSQAKTTLKHGSNSSLSSREEVFFSSYFAFLTFEFS